MLVGRIALLSGFVLALVACGSDGQRPNGTGAGGPGECAPPDRLVDGRCLEPGMQNDGCPAGTLGQPDGVCLPAGVFADLCAEGFVHDGQDGCDPILPSEPCPTGLMAVPGDSTCHPVMPCAEGKWGDIPIDDTTVFVDASYVGPPSDGTESKPFATLGEAVAAAAPGSVVAVAAGQYAEDVIISKPVRLWGVCPAEVSLVGQGGVGAIDIRVGANATEIVGLAVTTVPSFAGVIVSGSQDVSLERLWIHDALGFGIAVVSDLGPTSVHVRDTLVEGGQDLGVVVASSEATFTRLVVRDTRPWVNGSGGHGIEVVRSPWQDAPGPANVSVTQSVVERNLEVGMLVSGSEATLSGIVVRDTMPNDGLGGVGIAFQEDPESGAPSIGTLASSWLGHNRETGVYVSGSEAIVDGVVVRDTLPAASGADGRGILVQASATGVPSVATVTHSLIERSHDVGLLVVASDATVAGLAVRDTQPEAIGLTMGRGIGVQGDSSVGAIANANVSGSVVENNYDVGVFAGFSNVVLQGVTVRDTLASASDGSGGRGVLVQADPTTASPASATIAGSVVERSREGGVFILGSNAWLSSVAVRETFAQESDGLFGDGILLGWYEGHGSATIENSSSRDHARAGLSNFGAQASLFGVALECNPIDLAGELYAGQPASFEDGGGNVCGCGAPKTCAAASAGLTPPEALGDTP